MVGSTHTGRAGRVLPGSTAERLLHGSPCPVAVAPAGFAERAGSEMARIGVGFDGSAAARHALGLARRVAAATGAELRVIRAFTPLAFDVPPGSLAMGGAASYNTALRERAAAELDAAVEELSGEVRAEGHFAVGDAARVLAEASEELDLLLVGSRGYGPLHAVIVGGVAGRLVRDAACPVLVFPRRAADAEEDSIFGEATSVSG